VQTVAYLLAVDRGQEQAVNVAKLTNLRDRLPTQVVSEQPVAPPQRTAIGQAPAFAPDLVRRPALVSRLAEARACPLAVVTAPAGYGKTTLLAEWAAEDMRPFAWVALERGQGDAPRLAQLIAGAVGALRGSHGSVLVLDNTHLIRPRVLRDAVEALLPEIGEGSQIVLSGRTEPMLPLGRLRAQRRLVELGARELSMSSGEAAALLRAAGLDVEFETVQTLVRRTEGWPAALYLAALSLLARTDPAEGPASFGGEDHLVAEYVQDEFLAGLSPQGRTLLTQGSVLDRLSGPLCDEVLQRAGSDQLLAALARSNLPLAPLDSGHESYRLHGLLRETLQADLCRSDPQLARRLHRRASVWYADRGDFDRAIEHAVEASDPKLTGELMLAQLPRYLGDGRNARVRSWLDSFTAEHIAGSGPLALVAAHSHLIAGSIDLAQHWGRVAAAENGRAGARRNSRAVTAGIAIVQAWVGRSGTAVMADDAARASALLPDQSPWQASCCFLGGTAELLSGNRAAARRHFDEGADRGVIAAPNIAAMCLAQLAGIAIDDEQWETAEDLAERALSETERHHLSDAPLSALVFAVSAAVGAHEGLIVEAKRDLRQCGDLLRELDGFAPWYGAETRILLARAAMALADVQDARARLAEASRLARRTPDVVIFRQWFAAAWDEADTRAETALVGPSSLTTAELRVLRFLPTHYSFREIAQRLHVSSNTVKTQVHSVYRKLDASSRSEAVANASRAGLLGT
jgi:LuxR family transcriptional regulator, maltose regulon positive regulatory protein